ncbi:MAG: hypothetical protein O2851_08165 [Proteobacteria bacterium]|nr:hypothetical protein [Pseudomonadota bacterium]
MIGRIFQIVMLVFVLVQVAPVTSAQNQSENEAAIASAMAALDERMLTFNSRDPVAYAGSHNYPYVRFASGTVTIWHTAEEFVARESFERLIAQGWDHSRFISRDVVLTSPGKVHVNTVFQRFNANNESIGTYESLYIVTRDANGHWGTLARSSLAP